MRRKSLAGEVHEALAGQPRMKKATLETRVGPALPMVGKLRVEIAQARAIRHCPNEAEVVLEISPVEAPQQFSNQQVPGREALPQNVFLVSVQRDFQLLATRLSKSSSLLNQGILFYNGSCFILTFTKMLRRPPQITIPCGIIPLLGMITTPSRM
jgi:hypothetical protein